MIKVTCPHCNKEFICDFGGVSLHCYDYQDVESGKRFCAALNDGITECISCGKEFNLREHSVVERDTDE